MNESAVSLYWDIVDLRQQAEDWRKEAMKENLPIFLALLIVFFVMKNILTSDPYDVCWDNSLIGSRSEMCVIKR
jgi:hypothetical protein